jgi:glutamyl-tRNA synthetase
MITRFAPSPTGRLHIGNARTALFNALLARHSGGDMILRIEDTDVERSDVAHEAELVNDLRWLGIHWQQGPDCGGEHGPYRQSERTELYAKYYAELEEKHLAYPCFCSPDQLKFSRKAQLAAGQPPRYAGTCAGLKKDEIDARLAKGEKPTLRFRVPKDALVVFDDLVHGRQEYRSGDIGDFIIRRADGTPSFFFSNAIDDALMNVTHALRGEDHLGNTPRQQMLLEALKLRVPGYGHFALVQDSDGGPLSKRLGSLGIADLRGEGYLPLAVANYLARLGHSYAEERFRDFDELATDFDPSHFGRAPAKYDPAQLNYWQKQAVHRLGDKAFREWILHHDAAGLIDELLTEDQRDLFFDTIRDNVVFPRDGLALAESLLAENAEPAADALEAIREAGSEFFAIALTVLPECEDFRGFAAAVGERTGCKGRKLFMPLRAALTRIGHGPEMARVFELLGKPVMQARLEKARDLAE